MAMMGRPRGDWLSRQRVFGGVVLTLAVLGLLACPDEEEAGCRWELDDLLARVRAPGTEGRVFCGMVIDGGDPGLTDALDCFFGAPADAGAWIVVNHCIDCISHSAYYRDSRFEIIGIHRTAQSTPEEYPRRAVVTRCATLVSEAGYVKCSPPEDELYFCAEPESAWEVPEPPPVDPNAPAPPMEEGVR